MELLAELAASIGEDPARVARQSAEIAAEAQMAEDWPRLSRALAVRGRALRMLGEIDLAERALDEAIATGCLAGDSELAADAHLAMAGVLSIAGRWPAAFAHLDDVERLGSETLRDTAELQRAALCSDAGRTDEALRLITRAIPRLRRQQNSLHLARVLANRGGIRVGRGELVAAVDDFEEAEGLYRSIGQEFAALQTRHDLGCAFATLGDIPRALRLFDEVSERFIELGHDASVPLLSRAEALLVGGLSADALTFSNDAARRLRAEGNHSAAAEALVAVADAARLEGDHATAVDAARHAQEWFASRHAAGWERAAELAALRSLQATGDLDDEQLDRLEAIADASSTAGDVRGELSARALAAIAASERGSLERAERQAVLAMSAARRARLVQAHLTSRHAIASVRLAQGNHVAARRQLRTALNTLEATRHLHGAGEAIGGERTALAHLAWRVAAVETQPRRALAWMERARAAGSVSTPALPPDDEATAAGFAQLRSVAGDLRRAELAGAPTEELRRRQSRLEQSMRAAWLKHGGREHLPTSLPDVRALDEVIGDEQIVSIASAGDRLFAVVVGRRRSTLHDLGATGEMLRHAGRAADELRKMSPASDSDAVRSARNRAFGAAVQALDHQLLQPLGLDSRRVVLVVPAELHALPWAALPSLRRRSFSLAPSVSWWVAATAAPSTPIATALVVAGPRLAEAEQEAAGVAASHRRSTMLTGAEATVNNVSAALGRHDVAHVVAHGRFRHDNPLWSTIELVDGQLTVYELERVGRVPQVVVLATCESGVSGTRVGAQLHGLAGTLLRMGARTIVASIGALPDTIDTRQTMIRLHRDLANGSSAADSLADQRAAGDPGSSLTAAGLVTLGVG